MGLLELVSNFGPGGTGFEIALALITLSIIISGICIGLGIAFRSKKLKRFGEEELLQAVINAAILGVFALLVSLLTDVSLDLAPENATTCNLTYTYPGIGTVVSNQSLAMFAACELDSIESGSFDFTEQTSRAVNILSFASDIEIETGIVNYKPFGGLSSTAHTLSNILSRTSLYQSLLTANILLLMFTNLSMLSVFLPLGLIFRSFFITRKIGGVLLATVVSLYLIYPLILLVILPVNTDVIYSPLVNLTEFNSRYQPELLYRDLSAPDSITEFNTELSHTSTRQDLVESTYGLTEAAVGIEGGLLFYSLILPIIGITITLISLFHLSRLFSSEFITTAVELI